MVHLLRHDLAQPHGDGVDIDKAVVQRGKADANVVRRAEIGQHVAVVDQRLVDG